MVTTWLAVVPKAGGELFKGDAVVVIPIKAVKKTGDAIGVASFQRWKSGKFGSVETAVLSGNRSKFFGALGLEGSAHGIAGRFLFFVGNLAISIGVDLCESLGAAFVLRVMRGVTGCSGDLSLFLIDRAVFVEVVRLEELGELTVTKGAITAGSGKSNPDGEANEGEEFHRHEGGKQVAVEESDGGTLRLVTSVDYLLSRSKRLTPCSG